MNKTLALAAEKAITDPNYVTAPGYCQKFIREVVQSCYGDRYNAYFAGSAKQTGLNFLNAGIAKHGLTPEDGDILYKLYITQANGQPFPYGHVGIYTGKGVAENSSTKIGRVQGAKGYRTLSEFGHYDVIVRLPDPRPETHAATSVQAEPGGTVARCKVFRSDGTILQDFNTPCKFHVESGVLIVSEVK